MASCYKCKKPVYFAERIIASGKEFHKSCFTCIECGKVLSPGKHSEHKGLPYCEVPCYYILFGPNIYRQGYMRLGNGSNSPESQSPPNTYRPESNNSNHSLLHEQEKTEKSEALDDTSDLVADMTDIAPATFKHWPELEAKLAIYNNYYADTEKLQISSNEVGGVYILEGQLRIHWGLERPIRFKQKDETATPSKYRHSSYCFAVSNELSNGSHENTQDLGTILSPDLIDAGCRSPEGLVGNIGEGVVMRHRIRSKKRGVKRLSIINGHLYDVETSIFVPKYGSVTSVNVTTLDTCLQAIRLLLEKFKVENCPEEYVLCIVRSSGETRALAEADIPLLERLFLGPLEDDAKIFIVERHQVLDITQEVAPFVNLPEAVLVGFLEKCNKDEEKEVQWIKEKYNIRREALQHRLAEVTRL